MLRSAPLFLVLGLLLALRLPPALALYPYRDGWSQAPAATPVGAAARGARSGINLVYVLTLEGPVEPAAASYVNGWIERASRRGAAAVVLRLDTPGGLDSSLRSMVKAILASRAPVIVYVSPEGARAASAGVFLAYAAHVTAMAPATNIGAAHPVGIGGEAEGAAADKVVNDAVAYLRSLARLRGRDEGFAVEAVRSSRSLTAEEAVRRGAADLLAEDLDDLLRRLEGRRVRTAAGEVRLSFAGAAVEDRPMTARQRLLHALADPNLAYLLLVLGFYGLLFELASPGFGFAGIGGAISLILALYALQVVGVNYAGLALVTLAFVLFALDLFAPTHGALTAGGVLALLAGSLLLTDVPGGMALSLWLILPVTAATAALVAVGLAAGLRMRRRPVATGMEGLVGEEGHARSDLVQAGGDAARAVSGGEAGKPVTGGAGPEAGGTVLVHGEIWRARLRPGARPVRAGERVRVVAVDGLTLVVEQAGPRREGGSEDGGSGDPVAGGG